MIDREREMGFRFAETRKEEDEERLTMMVNDFIESETSFASSPTSAKNDRQDDILLSLESIVASSTNTEKLAHASVVRCLKLQNGSSDGKYNSKKGLVRSMRMEGYHANLCRSRWIPSLDCPGGAYEYIEIMAVDDHHQQSKRIIIDIDFSSQFEIARPTETYSLITNIIPAIFVGGETKLKKIVSLACAAAEKSLAERGLHIPPWRKANYMKSKWLSPCQRVPIASFPILNTERPKVGKFFDRDAETRPPATRFVSFVGRDRERSSAKVASNCVPPKLMPERRQLGFSQSSFQRCPTVA